MSRLLSLLFAFQNPNRYDEAAQEIANLRWQLQQTQALVRPIDISPLDARGVIVSRDNGAGGVGIQDEYSTADSWSLVPADGGDAWLHLFDLSTRQVTTYKPGQWTHVESGRLADITIKTEGETPTT